MLPLGKKFGDSATHLKTGQVQAVAFLIGKMVIPKRIIENCVFNMLPNGFPKKHLVKRLKVYQGDQHPHGAQDPKLLTVL